MAFLFTCSQRSVFPFIYSLSLLYERVRDTIAQSRRPETGLWGVLTRFFSLAKKFGKRLASGYEVFFFFEIVKRNGLLLRAMKV